MRDGVKISIDIYTKNISERLPVILEITPYGKRTGLATNFHTEAGFWIKKGYVFVIADSRGTGNSDGEFDILANEADDGYDIIEWITKQSWSNGKIGMRGYSYAGTNQWLIAAKNPPGLSCITPSTSLGKPIEHFPYYGAFSLQGSLNWISKRLKTKYQTKNWSSENPIEWLKIKPLKNLDICLTGQVLPLYRKILQHPILDSYWDKIVMKPINYSEINIPSLSFTGWYDFALSGTIMRFKEAVKYTKRKNDHFILIGPYNHYHAPHGGYHAITGKPIKQIGEVFLNENSLLPALNITSEFFDWCLKDGIRPSWNQTKIYITGSNEWDDRSFLISNDEKEKFLFLNKDGKLTTKEPNADIDFLEYDPSRPVRSDLIPKLEYPVNLNLYLNKSDFLVYTSDKLKKPLTIFDEIKLDLIFSSNVKDTDFVVFLMDVHRDGKSVKLGSMESNQLRTRYRYGFEREVLLEENKIYNLTINMHQIAHTFLAGHKIRLAITNSFYPLVSPNQNTGNPIGDDVDLPLKSKNTIYYGNWLNGAISCIKFKSKDDF
ncbi:X-Pro dipeptidyl-peptidase [Brachionus plicatilis]|uniref:X-Pro dipeptidyl-peptidase n=1 Tax=Brachionus plicatilis TaxID=10195 RepID=A0A3M7SAJ7_BRAPC|nr:X-Pro dipeptidyl-peptidase [Brachionus plicatilis]